jgi:DNA-binding response OmpR family regulator
MKKIVVVEDQQVMATIYRAKLTAEGFHVEVAPDGEQGLEVIMRTKPDLVLLDLMMPKLNGIEVLKTLRSMEEFKTLPVVVFSSSGGSAKTDEAWQSGATMVLSKANHSPKQLIESIRTALAMSADSQPITTSPTTVAAPVSTPEESRINESAKGHVLLVEDHPDTRALLAFVLDRAGHRVSCVESQAAALRQAKLKRFDLFLLNRYTPDSSGLSLCQLLRKSFATTPVVIYSTAALLSEQKEALQQGAAQYLASAEDLFNLGQISSDLINGTRTEFHPQHQAA